MTAMQKFVLEVMKVAMKPGYLYGVGDDGELYCIEAPTPQKGMALAMTAFLPKEESYTK